MTKPTASQRANRKLRRVAADAPIMKPVMSKPIHAIKWPSRAASERAIKKRAKDASDLAEFRKMLLPNWAGQFDDFEDWCNRASRLIGERASPVDLTGHRQEAICVDKKGRRCQVGADFMRARDEKAFPIRFFWNCEKQK